MTALANFKTVFVDSSIFIDMDQDMCHLQTDMLELRNAMARGAVPEKEKISLKPQNMANKSSYRISNTKPLSDTYWQWSAFMCRIAQICNRINSSK